MNNLTIRYGLGLKLLGAVLLLSALPARASLIADYTWEQHGTNLNWTLDWETDQTYIDALRPETIHPDVTVGNSINHGYTFPAANRVIHTLSWASPSFNLLYAGVTDLEEYDENRSWSFDLTPDVEMTVTQISFQVAYFDVDATVDDHIRMTASIEGDPEFELGLYQVAADQTLYNVLFDFDDFVVPAGDTVQIRTYARGGEGASNAGVAMDNLQVQGTLIPEPATSALYVIGVAGLAILRRRMASRV